MKTLLTKLSILAASALTSTSAHAQLSSRTNIISQITAEYQTLGTQAAIVLTIIFGLAAFGAIVKLVIAAFFQRAEPAEWFKYLIVAVVGSVGGLISFFLTGIQV